MLFRSSKITELFARYGDPDLPIHTAAVVDASRWEVLYKIAAPMMEQQLSGAKAVIVNKIDVKPPSPELLGQLGKLAPGAAILQVAACDIGSAAFWQQLEAAFS